MKYCIVLLMTIIAITNTSQAQITLDHTYRPAINNGGNIPVAPFQVAEGEWKYIVRDNSSLTVYIYSLDHVLEKTIPLPDADVVPYQGTNIGLVSKSLFALDDKYEFFVTYNIVISGTSMYHTRVYNEDGTKLFSSDSGYTSGIFNTPKGAKMILLSEYGKTEVYSLPGKFFPQNLSRGNSSLTSSSIDITAFPNPTTGNVRLEYTLPVGVISGQLILTSSDGKQVGSYPVGSFFNDITISADNLSSGTYYYKIVTSQGASETKPLIITK